MCIFVVSSYNILGLRLIMPNNKMAEDDVFDDEADDCHIQNVEWTRLESVMRKEGYKEGVSYSQDANLQQGFEDGFKTTVREADKMAAIRGIIMTLLGHQSIQNTVTAEVAKELEDLLERIKMLVDTSSVSQQQQQGDAGDEAVKLMSRMKMTSRMMGTVGEDGAEEVKDAAQCASVSDSSLSTDGQTDSGRCTDCSCGKVNNYQGQGDKGQDHRGQGQQSLGQGQIDSNDNRCSNDSCCKSVKDQKDCCVSRTDKKDPPVSANIESINKILQETASLFRNSDLSLYAALVEKI